MGQLLKTGAWVRLALFSILDNAYERCTEPLCNVPVNIVLTFFF